MFILDNINEIVEVIKNELNSDSMLNEIISKATQGDLEARNIVKERIKLCLLRLEMDDAKIVSLIDGYHKLTNFTFQNNELNNVDKLTQLIYQEAYGLSVIDELVVSKVNEVGATRYDYIWIQKSGIKERIPFKFLNEEHYQNIIVNRSCSYRKKHDLNPTNPYLFGERANGSRTTTTIPPFSGHITSNIRNFDLKNLSDEDIYTSGGTPIVKMFFENIYLGRPNFLIIGSQGVGKSSFLRYMARFIPDNLGLGTIETSFELNLDDYYPDKNVIKLCITDNLNIHDCFRIMLKQNRDIVFNGEISEPGEAVETVNAMTRMAKGSGGTFHSASPFDCIYDLKNLLMRSGYYFSDSAALFDVARAVDLIFHLRIDENTGLRYFKSITEVKENIKSGDFELNTLFNYDKKTCKLTPTGNKLSDNLKSKLLDYACYPEHIKLLDNILLGKYEKEGGINIDL